MKKLLILTILNIAIFSTISTAGEHGACTKWTKASSMSCVFNSRSSTLWVRQCMHLWDLESICMAQDPNQLTGACTAWVKESSIECYNGDAYAQSWIRSCAVANYKVKFCSDEDPNKL